MKDLTCPYCNTELDVCHDDGYGYEENTAHQMECEHCEKTFIFYTSISFYYEPKKADCLNDITKHEWKPSKTYPKEFSYMYCSMCNEKRKHTDDEMKSILNNS